MGKGKGSREGFREGGQEDSGNAISVSYSPEKNMRLSNKVQSGNIGFEHQVGAP